MRYTYRLPDECFSNPVVFRSRHVEWSSDPAVAVTKRLLCELFNDGQHLYMRRFENGKETPFFAWLSYRQARPLLCQPVPSPSAFVHLMEHEMIRIHLDGHLGTTALVMFGYTKSPTMKCIEHYLVIREGKSIRVELAFYTVRVKILFTSRLVC